MSGIAMVDCNCDYCGANMSKRVADRARGWGRFCDKSCKASFAANGPKKAPPTKKSAPKGKEKIIQELVNLARKDKPKRESIKDTPKPEGYGDFS